MSDSHGYVKREPTTEKLARALEAANDPKLAQMVARARAGYYDDYKSHLTFPCIQLVKDLTVRGHLDLASQAKNGRFDGQDWEADEWARSPEGVATRREFGI